MIPLLRRPGPYELEQIQCKISEALLEDNRFEPRKNRPHNLEEALEGEMPKEVLKEVPKSFDIVGDIAILELRPTLVQFEDSLAKAIQEVHPRVKAIFAKTGPVAGSERIRPLRHVAGENRTETIHREYGCSFKVDLARVFFSPRLSTEHQRVARQVSNGERVVDMFTGVGPFSILIAKVVDDVTVDAIDSNPQAGKLALENSRTNKVESKVRVHIGDARVVARQLGGNATRIIMNHPSAAKEFIQAACDSLQPAGGIVHYYTFAEGESAELLAKGELKSAVESSGGSLSRLVRVRRVREVASMNWQVAVDAEIIPRPRARSQPCSSDP